MAEIKIQETELEDLKIKAEAATRLATLANNAICYMIEHDMDDDDIADYLGCTPETVTAIDNEDFEAIAKGE